MGAQVSSVLEHKGNAVVTVTPQQTVTAVMKVLADNRIGAVPVMSDDGHLMGIISERDIIRAIAEHAEGALAPARRRT